MRTILYDPPEIEYLDGHPHAKVSPKTAHSFVQGALIGILAAKTRTILASSQNGLREYERGMRFEHEAPPWLVFDVDEVFADLDALQKR